MKKLILLAFIFLTFSLFWQGCQREEQTGTIYGTVTDYNTGEPLKNVSVKLRPSGEIFLTGADGIYSFKDLKPGNYYLSCSKIGYMDIDEDHVISLTAGKHCHFDVQMKKTSIGVLRITDMGGTDISVLDFGSDESLNAKSFLILNEGAVSVTCNMSYSCNWISSITSLDDPIGPGQNVPIIVTIDRSRLTNGDNSTILLISSDNEVHELLIKATKIGSAVVNTMLVTDITATSARSGGEIVDNGGSVILERGVCWNVIGTPDINDQHTINGNGAGPFTSNMTGLSPATTYYVRAYATNSMGTFYGNEVMFTTSMGLPTVTLGTLYNITATSASCSATVIDNGGAAIIERGICWSILPYPTVSNSHISTGTGMGTYTASLTDLTPSTTYYVRAYAFNAFGTSYSSEISFTTLSR